MVSPLTCMSDGCRRRVYRRGLCRACYDAARASRTLPTRELRRQAALVEDVEWLLTTGETHPDTIAFRLGLTRAGLLKALRRAGRTDLISTLTRVP